MQTEKLHDRKSTDLLKNAIVAIDVVDDPWEPGAKIEILRSTRDDPLAMMLSHGDIDKAKFEAGRLWQKYHEQSEIGSVQAIDTTKEAVDGGRFRELITNRQVAAFKQIAAADDVLGHQGRGLVRIVLHWRQPISKAAEYIGRDQRYTSQRFRECLETLARLWNLA